MDIMKNLNDYSFNEDQQRFVEYLRDNLDCECCNETIKNKRFILKYQKSNTGSFNIYTNALPGSSPKRINYNKSRYISY